MCIMQFNPDMCSHLLSHTVFCFCFLHWIWLQSVCSKNNCRASVFIRWWNVTVFHTFCGLINKFYLCRLTFLYVCNAGLCLCRSNLLACVCLHQSRQLESETGTTEEHSLNKEARKWATRVAREHKNIIHYKRVRRPCLFSIVTVTKLNSIGWSSVFVSVLFPVSGGVWDSRAAKHRARQTRCGAKDRRHQREHTQSWGRCLR